MTPQEFIDKLERLKTDIPRDAAAVLEAVISTGMVEHARADHPRQPFPDGYGTTNLKQLIAKSILARKLGKPQSGSHIGRRFYMRGGATDATIRAEPQPKTGNEIRCDFVAGAGASRHWPAAVEFGTKTSSPYPFMRPAVAAWIDKLVAALNRCVYANFVKLGLG